MPNIKISELIALLQTVMATHGDLECVYESWGTLEPSVHEVDGRLVMDLVA